MEGRSRAAAGSRPTRTWFWAADSLWFLIKYELIMLFSQNIPGALGVMLRKWLYPCLLAQSGKGCLFGRGVTLRHPGKDPFGRRSGGG